MKVSELITRLEEVDPDMDVYICTDKFGSDEIYTACTEVEAIGNGYVELS